MATLRLALATACLVGGASAFTCAAPSPRGLRALRNGRAAVMATEEPPAWFEDTAAPAAPPAPPAAAAPAEDEVCPPAPAAPGPPPMTALTMDDMINTKWKVSTTHREDGWLPGKGQEQEFTLLADGSVVWGGQAGGWGTGGRWQLTEGTLEVIRRTPLGLVTGRDYYMSKALARVDEQLQFEVKGIIRSYNALYPVAVVADFVAVRQPGRFVMNTDDDE